VLIFWREKAVRRKGKFLASGSACALLLSVVGVVLAVGGGSAKADTIIKLSGVTYLTQAVPDTLGGNSYLFVLADSEIIVTDLAGTQLATIDAGDGIGSIALSADGGTLYASVTSGADADSVAAITVSSIAGGTPKQTSYPLAAGDQPGSLAVQSGTVWVGYSTTTADVATWQIGAIDLPDGTFEPAAAPGSWAESIQLAADPDDTGVLVALDYQSQSEAETYNTATDPATPIAAQGELGSAGTPCSWLAQVAVMPGGQRFAVACTGAGVEAYNTDNVAAGVAFYNANGAGASLTTGVAVDADGSVAVANRTEIYVYKPAGALLSTLALGVGDELLEGKGLAWVDAPGGPGLAAAYGVGDAAPYAVHIFTQAELQRPTTLTLTASAPKSFGRPVTISGTSALAGAAGDTSPVTITRTGPGGSETLTTTPSSTGAFTVADTPKTAGTYTYTASVGPVSSAKATVKVPQNVPVLILAPGKSTVNYKTVLHLTATLGTTYVTRSLTIYAEVNGSGKAKVIAAGKVNAKGQLAVAYSALQSTTFLVAYPGDADDVAVQASTVVAVRAQVQEALSGQYGTKKSGGRTYLLYHRTGKVTVVAAVTPGHRGNCVQVETQVFAKGAWHASAKTGCATLNPAGKATVRLTVAKAALGYPYRVRADYLGGSPENASSASGWEYFMVEK
jgi:hypothetical protein